MPNLGDIAQIVLSVAGGVAGGGLLRAWGQNRNEQASRLTDEQQKFRQDQRQAIQDLQERNAYLVGRMDTIDLRNTDLSAANADCTHKIELQAMQIESMGDKLTLLYNQRETLRKLVERLELKSGAQEMEIAVLHKEIGNLRMRRADDAAPLAAQVDATRATDELKVSTDELKHATDENTATLELKTQVEIKKLDGVSDG